MTKFKVGDKVRRIHNHDDDIFGFADKICIVKKVVQRGWLILEGFAEAEMDPEKFELVRGYEIGKLYTDAGMGVIVECVDLTLGGSPIMKNPKYNNAFLYQGPILEEYVLPKTGKVWVNVYDGYTYAYATRKLADAAASVDRLACVEVSWVEGQGL